MHLFNLNVFDLLVYVCVALVGFILFFRLKNEKRRKLHAQVVSQFPGPPTRFLVGNGLNFLFKTKDESFMLLDYAKEYGSRYTLQINNEVFLVLSNAEDAMEILGSIKHVERGPTFLKSFARIFGNSTFSSVGHVWKKNRKILQFPFRTSILENYTYTMNDETNTLIHQFRKLAETGETFDALKYVAITSFNIFCREVMDVNADVPADKYKDYKESHFKHLIDCTERLFVPKFFTYLMDIMNKREYNKIKNDMALMHTKVLNDGKLIRSNTRDTKDVKEFRKFIYCLCNGPFTDTDIKEDIITYTAAATDTLGATISLVLLMLGIHQDIQDKVYDELCEIFIGEDRNVTSEDFKKMVYLDQVLKETQRMFPLVPLLYRYLTESVVLGQYTVPPGINIIIHTYAIQRDPRYFSEPDKFKPERFSPERAPEIIKGSFMPFSLGPRNCIGKPFAIHNLKITLSRILYNFHIKSDTTLDDIRLGTNFVLILKDGFPISVSARKH